MTKQEFILCASIYVDTGKKESESQSYGHPKTGLLFNGWRHSDCFVTLQAWIRCLSFEQKKACMAIDKYALRGKNQGFLTSKGRFVNREEAWHIAAAAGQIENDPRDHPSLMSEDLY